MRDEEIIEKFEREEITLASVQKRFFAFVVDEILISVLFIMIYLESVGLSENMEQNIQAINNMVVYVMLLKIIYQAFFVWMYGASLGKIFLKIRVVSVQDLENPSILYATIRSVMRVVSESVFYLGFFWALMNPKRETWHDKAAKTLVVNAF